MAGRPRKPTAQKKAEGTYRPDRDLGVKIESLDKMPAPGPKLKLSKDAVGLWYSYGNQLIFNGLMSFLDIVTFSRYCQLYDNAMKLQADIERNGFTQTSEKSGFEMARPQVGMLSTTQSEMLKIEDRFGLSPNSRAKIPAQKKEDNGDDFDKALNA